MQIKFDSIVVMLRNSLRFLPLAISLFLAITYTVALIYVKTRDVFAGQDVDLLEFYHEISGNIVLLIALITPSVFIFTRRKKYWLFTLLAGALACILHIYFYTSFQPY
jgi:hypothetical protein